MPDLRPRLRVVRTPLDILVGERDEKFVALGREISAIVPAVELTVVPAAGHNLLLERSEMCRQRLVRGEP